ncbi:putative phage minor tail protein [Yersinia frederiksenii]|nr:putative phage minor tail protein [Yersinia frederiksenii]
MIESEILAHAKASGARESCGLIVAGGYFPCRNIALNPTEYFDIHPDDWIAAEEKGDIEAIVHSHPNGIPFLSEGDRKFQVKSGIPWWLVCNNKIHKFNNVPHLLNRTFKHGEYDCYSLFRDAYHLAGFDLPDFKRNDDWWKTTDNLYLDNMIKNDFYRIAEIKDIQPGDVILCCLGTEKANHSMIYIGNQQVLHHRPNRLSKRDVYGGFLLDYTHSIWRYKKWSLSCLAGITADLAVNTN